MIAASVALLGVALAAAMFANAAPGPMTVVAVTALVAAEVLALVELLFGRRDVEVVERVVTRDAPVESVRVDRVTAGVVEAAAVVTREPALMAGEQLLAPHPPRPAVEPALVADVLDRADDERQADDEFDAARFIADAEANPYLAPSYVERLRAELGPDLDEQDLDDAGVTGPMPAVRPSPRPRPRPYVDEPTPGRHRAHRR